MSEPTDLEDLGYGRGKLRPGPAASVRRIDVILGRPLDINSAYRDYNEQMRKYLAYVAYQNGRGPWAPLALHPDRSWHCKGLAIDTDDRLAIFGEHGWRFEVRDEPWHGQYYTSLDKHYGETASGGATPFPTPDPVPKEWDEMATEAQIRTIVAEEVSRAKTASGVAVYEWLRGDGTVWAMVAAPGIKPLHIESATERDVIVRYLSSGPDEIQRFNSGEHNILVKWLPLLTP